MFTVTISTNAGTGSIVNRGCDKDEARTFAADWVKAYRAGCFQETDSIMVEDRTVTVATWNPTDGWTDVLGDKVIANHKCTDCRRHYGEIATVAEVKEWCQATTDDEWTPFVTKGGHFFNGMCDDCRY